MLKRYDRYFRKVTRKNGGVKMDLLLWITVGFIVIGFVVLISMKKSMERRVALIIENEGSMEGKQISNKPVVWWISGATVWGLVSIFLIVRSFSIYM
jgi:hypothetical protein